MIGREGLHRQVLLDIVTAAGGGEAASYISTGNVSFEVEPGGLGDLVAAVDHEVEAVVGRRAEMFVRSREELEAMLEADPFADSPFPDPVERTVTFFQGAVPASFAVPYQSGRHDFEVFAAGPREVFSVGRDVDGRRQAPGGTIERLSGERVTSRAWSTIGRIVSRLS